MLQPSLVPPAPPLAERFRTEAGRRTLAIGLALLIEGLMLLLLLSVGSGRFAEKAEEGGLTVVTFRDAEVAEEAPAPDPQERPRPEEARPAPERPERVEPVPVLRPEPEAPTPPQVIIPMPNARPLPAEVPRPAPPARPVYGPVDRGTPAHLRDTERVGTAPNGEPLYAAAWYREPRSEDLRAYLSTARGPGWGLIACRTAPDYRVEDCVGLDEYPEGSQITRAVLAAAWEFRVRPPRRGGQVLVGSWVRIRIDYRIEQN